MIFNDYLGLIGYSGLTLGLGFTVIGLFAGGYFLLKKDLTFGWIQRVILLIQFICLAVSVFSLAFLLLNNAFEYPIVFDSVEKSMPWLQKFSGLWSGQSSSLLFWSFILSAVILIFSGITKRVINDKFSVLVSLILGISLIFFLTPVLILSNPFEKLWQLTDGSTLTAVFAPTGAGLIVPMDGMGMNPSLRHIAMLLHPPFLYLGLVGFFVPYAVSLAVLIRGDQGTNWIRLLMPVTVIAWVCLTLGMVLGSWWAYTILGWGGYWGWDAVGISGLLPWMLSFGLIHSLRMHLSGKKYLNWILVFSGLIFISILSGILVTRSGILESVHAYSVGVMGPVLSIFIVINLLFYLLFFFKRLRTLKINASQNKLAFSDHIIRIFNYLILALVLLFFIGQTYPLTSELITGKQVTWSAEQYELFSSPFLFLLLIVTALCPLSNLFEKSRKRFWRKLVIQTAISILLTGFLMIWKKSGLFAVLGFWAVIFLIITWAASSIPQFFNSSAKNKNDSENKGRLLGFGSILIHIGLGLMALGIMGQEALSDSYDLEITEGESVNVGGFQILLQDSSLTLSTEGTTSSVVDFSIVENSQKGFMLSPDLEYYPKMQMLYARPAISSNFQRDIQVILNSWKDENVGSFGVHIAINPLMIWIWIGGLLMSFGGIIILGQQWIFKRKK
jgi:cytochrome c-type biogenesis protein CcmF